jgi:trehalose 6-phosphate phosphatase
MSLVGDDTGLARALAEAADRPDGCGFFFDFDGTLAHMHDDPDAAQPVAGVLAPLAELAALVDRVAIVSARPVSFLRSRFGGAGEVALYGLYGLESALPGGPVHTQPEVEVWAPIMVQLAERARRELPPDTIVEFKRLSVALHYRAAPERGDVVTAWAARLATELGLRQQVGRMVVELRPPVDADKGSVLAELIEELDCAWYIGDDVSDLAAFQALTDRERQDTNFHGVRVAVRNPESGAEVEAAADFVFASPTELPAFLTRAVEAIRAGAGTTSRGNPEVR